VRAFLIAVALLLVGLVAAVLVGPSFLDWNGQKARIASEISRFTGRPLTIAGDMSLTLLPTPRLTATDVRLANIDGASTPSMADVEELEIQIDFWPLLRGRVQIESFALVRPQINLEVMPDGRRNWDFAMPFGVDETLGQKGRLVDDGDRRLANQIKLEDFRIVDGRLVYRDPEGSQTVEKLDAEVSAGSLLGPFSLVGSGFWHGNDVRVVLNLGRLVREGAATVNLDVAFPEEGASLRFNGGVLRDRRGLALRGQMNSNGRDLVGFLGVVAPDLGPLPPILARSFAVTTEVRLDRSALKATELSWRLDESQLEGSLDVAFAGTTAEPTDVALDLKATRLDLDSLLAGPPVPSKDAQSTAENAGREAGALPPLLAPRFALPKKLSGHLTLAADSLVFRERLVRQMKLEADLAGGELTLSKAALLLPGGSEFSVSGSLTTPKREPKFDGRVETSSNNFRVLLGWLGADISAVPANRLRRMSFTSAVLLEKGQLTAQGFDLQLDLTKASGGLAVALRKRLGFGLGMTVDSINLDAYLDEAGDDAEAALPKPATPEGTATVEGDGDETGETALPDPRLGIDLAAFLGGFDANFDISVGSVTLNRMQAKGLHLDGTLREGNATIREARLEDFFGADVAYRGELQDLRGEMLLDGRFDLTDSAPNRLWKGLTGTTWKYGKAGNIAASGSLRGPLMAPHIEGSLTAYGGEVAVAGDLKIPTLSFDLSLDAEHPSLSDLFDASGLSADLNPDLGGGLLTGEMIGNPSSFRFEDLAGRIGATEFAGRLLYDGTRTRPYVEAELDSGPLAWPALFKSEGQEAGKLVGVEGPQSRNWSRAPLDIDWLEAFDGRLALTSEALAMIGFWLEDATVTAVLKDAVLTVEELKGRLFNGSFALTGEMAPADVEASDADDDDPARRSLQGRFSVQASDVDAESLLEALFDVKGFGGKLGLRGNFETAGKSEAQLIASLAGEGRVDGQITIALPKDDLGLSADAKRVQGVADGVSSLETAFLGAPVVLAGDYKLRKGTLSTKDFRLTGRGAKALTVGTLDLSDWEIQSRTDYYRDGAPDEIYLSVKLKGPLAEPDLTLSGSALDQ